jgi:hypothetical protein
MSIQRITTRAAAVAFSMTVMFASVGFAPSVRAADTSYDKVPGNYAAIVKMKAMDIMHMMDGGKTGFVDRQQFMKFHEAMFEKMDRNKDDKLSREEWLGQIHSSP